MRVLIVEDDRSVGSVLQDFLLELGHESELVLSAEGALDRLHQNRPDLILLDFRLPGINGLDFLQRQRLFLDQVFERSISQIRHNQVMIHAASTGSQASTNSSCRRSQ